MNDTKELIEPYLESCDAVRAAYAGMTREQAMAHPVAGKWSSLEVLCHLVDADFLIASRIRA
ncbi:DinB family protein, partial [Singulisphaera rosea]